MAFINLTPHAIRILSSSGGEEGVQVLPPSGEVARCSVTSEPAGELDGVSLVRQTYGAVTGLPEPVPGTLYVVSAMVRAAVGRADLASPGDQVRDASGNVIACRGLPRAWSVSTFWAHALPLSHADAVFIPLWVPCAAGASPGAVPGPGCLPTPARASQAA